jgi:hypothetical protein
MVNARDNWFTRSAISPYVIDDPSTSITAIRSGSADAMAANPTSADCLSASLIAVRSLRSLVESVEGHMLSSEGVPDSGGASGEASDLRALTCISRRIAGIPTS